MQIRAAKGSDSSDVLWLARDMHAASRYAAFAPFDIMKMAQTFGGLVEDPDGFAAVAERDGVIVGAMLGVMCEYPFSRARYAADLGLYILPGARGGVGRKLTEYFSSWAAERGAVRICQGVTAGIQDRAAGLMLGASGFTRVGQLYEREV